MNYTVRKNCIFCNNPLEKTFFEKDRENPVGHYPVDLTYSNFVSIPYNICICNKCNTPQMKYLGELEEVYRINHADGTGTTMHGLHVLTSDFIAKYKEKISNILEIGSSKGLLADIILNKLNLTYNIIEPSFFGERAGKNIIDDFYENVDDKNIDANTIILSHVFEHFYEPLKILQKIYANDNIKNVFLVFPDLEYYINNNVLHVLNTEHTFYVDNDFIINLFKYYGFDLIEKRDYVNHSVLFYFARNEKSSKVSEIDFQNKNFDINKYFNNIFKTVELFNKSLDTDKPVYLWPSSIHCCYLFIFGLNEKKLSGFLDNSKLKIGKKMYGTELQVYPFLEKIKDKDITLLVNGGVFTKEVDKLLSENNVRVIRI